MTYIILFFTALLAATLLPGGSEALLLYNLSQNHSITLLFFAATLGNTAGSVINFFIGQKGSEYLIQKKYVKKRYLTKAHDIFKKYGAFALLLSWMPIVGDPITFIAGVLKYDFRKFVLLVLLAKGVRYGVIIGFYILYQNNTASL